MLIIRIFFRVKLFLTCLLLHFFGGFPNQSLQIKTFFNMLAITFFWGFSQSKFTNKSIKPKFVELYMAYLEGFEYRKVTS